MTNINWDDIYDGTVRDDFPRPNVFGWRNAVFAEIITSQPNRKFDVPIKPLPWLQSFDENVHFTLEWLLRDHRRVEARLNLQPLVRPCRRYWYMSDFEDAKFSHVCYPQDLLKFRSQYDGAFEEYKSLPKEEMSKRGIEATRRCKALLWQQWHCIGKDGHYSKETGQLYYKYACSRCGEIMPRGVKMFIILTKSKLKDA